MSERVVQRPDGLEGGYGLYLRDGKPTFVYNFLGADRPTFAAREPLPKGKVTLVVDSNMTAAAWARAARSP
jgi:hypothetical protein